MGRFDLLAHFLSQLGEKLPNHIVWRESVAVLPFEILFTNNAARVDIEESGVRHSFVLPRRFRVQDVEADNNLGIGVGQ